MTLEEIDTQFSDLQQGLIDAVNDAKKSGEATIREKLSEVANEIKEALERVEGVVDEQRDKLEELLENAGGVITSIENRLNEFDTVIEECRETTNEWFEAVDHGIEELESTHSSAVDMADEALESAYSLFQTVSDQIDAFCENVASAIASLVDGSVEQIQESVLQPLHDARDVLLGNVQQLLDELIGEVFPTKMAEINDIWISEIHSQLAEMIGVLQQQLDEFRSSVIERADTSAGQRDEAKLMMDQLDAVLAPVMDSLGRISSLASSVGISIG